MNRNKVGYLDVHKICMFRLKPTLVSRGKGTHIEIEQTVYHRAGGQTTSASPGPKDHPICKRHRKKRHSTIRGVSASNYLS